MQCLLGVCHSFTVCDINYCIVVTGKSSSMLGSLDFLLYAWNIVELKAFKSGFCCIQFSVTFAGIQNVDHQLNREYR